MKRTHFAVLVPFLAIVLACDTLGIGGPTRRAFTVQAYRSECVGVFLQWCYLVKEPGQPDFQFLYESIEGFNYQWGYVYDLEVDQEQVSNPPEDASPVRVVLHKLISQVRQPEGSTFDLVLTGSPERVTQVGPGRYRVAGGPEFSCASGVSCDDLLDRFRAGKRIHFHFAFPLAPTDALSVLQWDECARQDVVFVCNP